MFGSINLSQLHMSSNKSNFPIKIYTYMIFWYLSHHQCHQDHATHLVLSVRTDCVVHCVSHNLCLYDHVYRFLFCTGTSLILWSLRFASLLSLQYYQLVISVSMSTFYAYCCPFGRLGQYSPPLIWCSLRSDFRYDSEVKGWTHNYFSEFLKTLKTINATFIVFSVHIACTTFSKLLRNTFFVQCKAWTTLIEPLLLSTTFIREWVVFL